MGRHFAITKGFGAGERDWAQLRTGPNAVSVKEQGPVDGKFRGHLRAKGVGLRQMDFSGFLLKAGQREKIW